MHQAAQSWLVFELTHSPFYLGLAGTAASAPILLFTLAGGILADRYPKRKILLTAHILLMTLVFILTLLTASGVVTIWHILTIAFLTGTVLSLEIPSRQSFIVELVGKEDLLNGIAMNSTAFHGARMAGPAIAGFILGLYGPAWCFFINTLSFLAIIAALLKMHIEPETGKRPESHGIAKEFRDGFRYIFNDANVCTLMISVGIISFFGFPYLSFLPVYASDILKTGPTGLGMLMGYAGAGAFSGAIFLAVRGSRTDQGILMAAAALTFSAALLIFSVSEKAWLSYFMLFFVGLGAINHIATANSLIQFTVPDELRGRVMSSFTTMFLGMAPLGNFTVGTLAHYIGTRNALLTSACFCLTGTVIVLIKRPWGRNA